MLNTRNSRNSAEELLSRAGPLAMFPCTWVLARRPSCSVVSNDDLREFGG